LGLAAAVGGGAFETTVEALERCRVDFASRKDLVDHLRRHPEAAWGATVQLCTSYLDTHRLACTLGGSTSVLVRLARLFIGWVPVQEMTKRTLRLDTDLTHQQISEMIGTTRETVTRSLSSMRNEGLVMLKGRELLINDLPRLQLLAGH
jgi:CRP/FNR family cyclic AMP-dependent transcriptional regulator